MLRCDAVLAPVPPEGTSPGRRMLSPPHRRDSPLASSFKPRASTKERKWESSEEAPSVAAKAEEADDAAEPALEHDGSDGEPEEKDEGGASEPATDSPPTPPASTRPAGWFPVLASEPKVLASRDAGPGQPPRRLLVERRKRLFAQQDIEMLLVERGVDLNSDEHKLGDASGLALGLFDDLSYDTHSDPSDWLALGVDPETGAFHGLPAKALRARSLGGTAIWTPCVVLGFDADDQRWQVRWANAAADAATSAAARLEVLFDAENPFHFADRVRAATDARAHTLAALRYNLIVDCMPTDGVPSLDSQQMARVVDAAIIPAAWIRRSEGGAFGDVWEKVSVAVQRGSPIVSEMVAEMQCDFARTLNKVTLGANLGSVFPPIPPTVAVGGSPARSSALALPSPAATSSSSSSSDESAEGGEFAFATTCRHFAFSTLLSKFETSDCLRRVHAKCEILEKRAAFRTEFSKSLLLSEFNSSQKAALKDLSEYLSNDWAQTITQEIQETLRDVGKGGFKLDETNNAIYQMSKLCRFFAQVNFQMSDALKFMQMRSIESYVEMVIAACNDAAARPLFSIDLVVHPDGTLAFRAGQEPVKFASAVLGAFDNCIETLGRIKKVEWRVMDGLFWSYEPVISTLRFGVDNRGEPLFATRLRARLEEAITSCEEPVQECLRSFDVHLPFLKRSMEEEMEELMAQYTDEDDDVEIADAVEGIAAKAREHKALHAAALVDVPMTTHVRAFWVKSGELRNELASKHERFYDELIKMLVDLSREQADKAHGAYGEMIARLDELPQDIEALTELEDYMESTTEILKGLDVLSEQVGKNFVVVDAFNHMLETSDCMLRLNVLAGPKLVSDKIAIVEVANDAMRVSFSETQNEAQEEFAEHLKGLASEVNSLNRFTDIDKAKQVSVLVGQLRQRIDEASEMAMQFNKNEQLFGTEVTDYDVITKIKKDFMPFCLMWEAVDDWRSSEKSWREDPFNTLVPKVIENKVQEYSRSMKKIYTGFAKRTPPLEGCAAIARTIFDSVNNFKPLVPMIQALRHAGMKVRHWEQLSEQIGIDVMPSDSLTLDGLLEMGLDKHIEIIDAIGVTAQKEYAIEKMLNSMQDAWKDINLELLPYEGTFKLAGIDETMELLDEHRTLTQQCLFSPYKAFFEERIALWDHRLSVVSEVIEEWLGVQRSWLHLQPIFDSPDIKKQLPQEASRFETVDKNWRDTCKKAYKNPRVIEFCAAEKLREAFKESNKFLAIVQKGLSDYLETKRTVFSRFYFLADEDLLQILSDSKNPKMVQPHLGTCFEAIKKVTFLDDMKITTIISREKEKIDLVEVIDPIGANVEDWMKLLELGMIQSVKDQMWKSILSYTQISRVEWMQTWPGMCVINASMMHWVREMEAAMKESGADGVKLNYEGQLQQLENMVDLVRDPTLGKLARSSVGALAVMDVHARDVTLEMVEVGTAAPEEFEWVKQLRYYWEIPKGFSVEEGHDLFTNMPEGIDPSKGDLFGRILSAYRPYAYEYLGNSFRLVITPLTDKCYLTLMGALQMLLGGAPAGPAGTGKTETVKDLAKALAKQCVVFNCNDEMGYLMTAKFFKGLASCGAWCCFDEFNRILIEVLSVIAQQIMQLQDAIKDRTFRCMFEGTDLPVNDQFAVFITMNPGYPGRTELPDNLAALFRPVAMMVPDYALIGEIMLFAFGFEASRKCAEKMVATFQLCSEQLSSQDHYDYGMRAVKTVIVAAGLLKRESPDEDEELLMLRGLTDVNLPKFLAHDLPLFVGIMGDLFPGKQKAIIDYGMLTRAIMYQIELHDLQAVPWFVDKVIQLYEMIVVRHGLMVVGPTMGGKSNNIHILRDALSMLYEAGEKGNKYEPVKVEMINPKSITMSQLYGSFDSNTHEWHDGVLAKMIRELSSDRTSRLEWVHFDGPVDTLWIESLNTVLDDNKKLCLNSGAVLPLSDTMTMMFEPADLAVASPATVSRCGMVYMEPTSLGYMCLIDSWLQFTLPSPMRAPGHQGITTTLRLCFDNFIGASLVFLRRYLIEPVPTVNNSLIRSLVKILDCYFEPFMPKEGRAPATKAALTNVLKSLESYFIFALVWSIGCTCDKASRSKFDAFLRQEMAMHSIKHMFPDDGTSVYDYALVVDPETGSPSWVLWPEIAPPAKHDTKAAFADMIVQTADTVKYTYLLELLVEHKKHCLISGPTGTGKTVNIAQKLFHGMPKMYVPLQFTFSARTSANMTQNIIDGKTDKRRKGIYGPMVGKQFVIFIDDVNMPQPEVFGAQPPIELMRQWCCAGGWYDMKELTWRSIVDTILVLACGPPGGGRNDVTPRFFRHFNLVGYTDMQNDVMYSIFNTIFSGFLAQFSEECQAVSEPIVHASIDIFNTCSAELLPTPAKSHYTFNLRDLGKVFQGMLMGTTKTLSTPEDVVRMWVHECSRVFRDRLVNDHDRDWFTGLLKSQLSDKLGMVPEEVIPEGELIFADFIVPGADPKLYTYVEDTSTLMPVIQDYLQDYNVEITGASMNLIMFMDAIKHISRISRVLRQPRGNALLLGVGGSGRQSLTRLASFMAEFRTKQIEIKKNFRESDWHEDLRSYLLEAGVDNKHVTFLFVDTQIVFEGMLEDVNNVLNSGDVPNLYGPEEMEAIASVFAPLCKIKRIEPSKLNIFNEYVKRVQSNLHVVVAMSPVGDAFRRRLLMFPALINCCTIDWFTDWPEEALQSVATDKLNEGNLALGDSFSGVVEFMKNVHRTAAATTVEYREQAKRWNYVTPTSYLQLISTYRSLLDERRTYIGEQRRRLKNGYDKIIKTESLVGTLEIEVKELEPVLVVKNKEVGEMIVKIDADKLDAAATKAIVDDVRTSAEAKAAEATEIKDSATRDLDKAIPLLAAAVQVLNQLEKSDIDVVKSFSTVLPPIMKTMQICCLMFEIPPKMEMKDGKKSKNWHAAAKVNLLGNAGKFVDMLKAFDKDTIPDKKVKQLKKYFDDEQCSPEAVKRSSQACYAVCCWARAMYQYDLVVKEVAPKRIAQAAAEAELKIAQKQLSGAVAELKVVEDRIAGLEADFNKANDNKQMYEDKMIQCSERLVRAGQLTSGLGGEKVRWLETVEKLGVAYANLVGDVLVSAGYVAYLGAFTPAYRSKIAGGWREKLIELNLPYTIGCDIRQTLADPVTIRGWNVCELPTDNHSIENGIMMQKAWRWSLFIDPQGQANRFIKNLGKEAAAADSQRALMVTKQTAKDFARTLENGVRFGREVLLENIGEELDATLEPILQRNTFKAEGSTVMIKIGDSTIAYDDRFKFYMTTKLPNPHYPPEVCVKVTLLNFTITPQGLSDQLLGVVTEMELPELQARNLSIVRNIAKMNKELKEIQDKILYLLSNAEEGAALLDNVELIDALSEAKVAGDKIGIELADAEIVKANIDTTRVKYMSVAERGSTLYFCIAGLRTIAPMYEYSLQWFTTNVFRHAVANAEPNEELEVRKANLIDFLTNSLYVNICRSLFERHKLLLSFLMAIRIARHANDLEEIEWGFLISGTIVSTGGDDEEEGEDDGPGNPAPEWLDEQSWTQLKILAGVPKFAESHFLDSFAAHITHWLGYFDSTHPHTHHMPDGWDTRLNLLQKMCVLRCLRPDKIVEAVQLYVIDLMDDRFVKPPPFSLAECFTASNPASPLIFVLSKGSDPTKIFNEFATQAKMTKKTRQLSLGQGQDRKAEAFIQWGQESGGWVYLQNCHLYVSWMNTLERLCEDVDLEACHRDYRLWLSSMPSTDFPTSVLQSGVKMTLEPPKGMRSNMRNAYYSMTDADINKTVVPHVYRKMLFALLFFHALVQERKKYGPLGWNISYSFNDTDSDISRQQLELFLNLYPTDTPFQVLHFLTAYINYGGRVTDYTDLRVTDAILIELYTPKLLEKGYSFSKSGLYYSLEVENEDHPHAEYMAYIEQLPINPDPEIFGMHANANITCARAETDDLFDTMTTLEASSSASGGGATFEEIVEAIAADIALRLPAPFDVEAVQNTYPRKYDESMNTVLAQECGYYNKMIAVLVRTLPELRKAMKGLVVLSSELEAIANAMVVQRVPEPWGGMGVSYPCLKPLTGWVNEFFDRLSFLQQWIDGGIPVTFWIPGFYFPQAFLTGALQNYARKFQLPIDQISFEYKIQRIESSDEITDKPDNGCIIYGIHLEGARWDMERFAIADSLPKKLFSPMPVIHLDPMQNRPPVQKGIYRCPVYKVVSRWGILATTGHSSNFIMWIELPSDRDDFVTSLSPHTNKADSKAWIKAGVAAFCSLKY